ncbi:MAG: GerMN domain-containing protein [Tissierellia bacterium]|nr:GerMN domain-containing protein [Tissierellia bacterium]
MKKIILYFTIFTLLFPLVACSQEENKPEVTSNTKVEANENENNVVEEHNAEESEESTNNSTNAKAEDSEKKDYHVKLYFPTEKYVVDGDEHEKMVVVEKDLKDSEDSIASNTLFELAKGTEEVGVENFIKPETFHSAILKDGIVTVDLNKYAISDGDLDEEITLNQIIQTLLSIEGIKGVSFLVDGEEAESLYGHYDLTKVYTEGLYQ